MGTAAIHFDWHLRSSGLPDNLSFRKTTRAIHWAFEQWRKQTEGLISHGQGMTQNGRRIEFRFDRIPLNSVYQNALGLHLLKNRQHLITFNTFHRWAVCWHLPLIGPIASLFAPATSGIVEETALHEIGHALGISHISSRSDCVMSPERSQLDEAPRLRLTDADLLGAQFLLGPVCAE